MSSTVLGGANVPSLVALRLLIYELYCFGRGQCAESSYLKALNI